MLDQQLKQIKKKSHTDESVNALFKVWELTLDAFKSEIFSLKPTHRKGLKILSPKQMLKRLPIGLAQVQEGNAPENLLNEICQII